MEQSLEIPAKKEIDKPAISSPEEMTIYGMKEALTKELIALKIDHEVFWKKIESKTISISEEIDLFKPLFNTRMLKKEEEKTYFVYELNIEKLKIFFKEIVFDAKNDELKTFYIVADFNLGEETSWDDLGVTKKENFSLVVTDAWKKWIQEKFKSFENVVILEKDLSEIPSTMNVESVTLKWNSLIRMTELLSDKRSAHFETTAQFVLVNTKTNEAITSFDFPNQKKNYGFLDKKKLSSDIASLTYNLLTSQMTKIQSSLDLSKNLKSRESVETKIIGKHGLLEISNIKNLLENTYKEIHLTFLLKNYSFLSSEVVIKSTLSKEALFNLFSKNEGKLLINEQKILLFNLENQTFAIISKEVNN